MNVDKAKRDLESLPNSPKRAEALRILEEIAHAEQKRTELLDRMIEQLQKLTPTAREERLYKLLPWLIGATLLVLLYIGVDAVVHSAHCERYRNGSVGCSTGIRAQLQGVCIISAVLLLCGLLLRASRLKTIALWFLGLLSCGSFIAATLM